MTNSNSPYGFIEPRQAITDMKKCSESILPRLVDEFCERYAAEAGGVEISEIRLDRYSYLFDHSKQRLVAAYGNTLKSQHVRDKYRQQGHPSKKGSGDDKGHAIAHSTGGGMDINIFPQETSLNRGAFRRLEKLGTAYPGSFYMVRLIYGDDSESQQDRTRRDRERFSPTALRIQGFRQ